MDRVSFTHSEEGKNDLSNRAEVKERKKLIIYKRNPSTCDVTLFFGIADLFQSNLKALTEFQPEIAGSRLSTDSDLTVERPRALKRFHQCLHFDKRTKKGKNRFDRTMCRMNN